MGQKNLEDSYIVRIYRRAMDQPNSMVGIVEHIDLDCRIAFHNKEELWSILTSKNNDNKE